MSWKNVTLGEVCEFKYGKSLPDAKRVGGSVFVFGSNGIVGQHDEAITSGASIIIGRKGSLGEINFSDVACWPIDTTYFVDKSATNADLKWLSYRLKGLGLTRLNRSAAVPGLNREDAYRQRLFLPPLPEQRRIAAILDQADALRAKRREALAQLDSLTQSIFIEMFGDPASNPKGWNIVPLGKVIDDLTDYHANGSYETLRNHVELLDSPNFALMLRTTDLENNDFSTAVKYITEASYNFLKKSQVFGGEIIINKIGSAGSVYLAPYLNRPVSLGMNSFLLRIAKCAHSRFIYEVLTSDYTSGIIRSKVRGAVTKTITNRSC